MTTILATSDNHLGFRQYGMLEREQDIENAFHNIVSLAIELRVDAITVSGDLIHSTRPTSRTMDFLSSMHTILKNESIPCLVSSGNHDKSEPHWIEILGSKDDWKDGGFRLIDNQKVDIGVMTIYGQPFVSRKEWEEKKNDIPDVDVLLMHQSFSEFAFANPDTSFYPKDLRHLNVNTIVMGDTHVTEEYELKPGKEGLNTVILSPGSSELISAVEPTNKGVILLHKDAGPEADGGLVRNLIPIKTRSVIKGLVENEDDVRGIIDHIANKIVTDSDNPRYQEGVNDYPLVFIEYDPEVAYVIDTIRREWPGIMLRAKPKRVAEELESEEAPTTKHQEAVDILERMLINTTHPATDTLAHELLKPECDVNVRLDDYIQNRRTNVTM